MFGESTPWSCAPIGDSHRDRLRLIATAGHDAGVRQRRPWQRRCGRPSFDLELENGGFNLAAPLLNRTRTSAASR